MSQNDTIEVHHKKGEEDLIEMLTWPQNYENFIKDIIAKFKLNKNTKIELQLITNDEDDTYINSQDDLNPYLEEDGVGIKYFNVLFEANTDLIEENGNNENVEPIQDIKIEEINIDEIMKDVFNSDDYKQNLKSDKEKLSQNFKNNLEKSIDDILVEKKNNINKNIELELSQYLKASQDNITKIKNSVMDFSEEIKELKENSENMSSAINELKESIASKEIVLSKADALREYRKGGGSNIPKKKEGELEVSEVENPNPLGGIEEDDNNDNKIPKIEFEQNNIEKIIEMKDAKFININDIKIKNVGNISAHKLFFIKNKEKSSNDFCFFGNSKATDEYELSMPGELKPNESLNCNISMAINNAQPGQKYNIILNAKENKEIISEPFEIIIRINKPQEDPLKQKQTQANQIYEEIKNKFPNHNNLINKDEIINKLINNNLNKNEIINDINNKIKEITQKENEAKAEQIYNELNLNNINIDKNEIISIIKEKNFDKEEVQKWLVEKAKIQNKQKAQNLYNNLRNEQNLDFSKCANEEAILNKIIELKFNENEIRNFFKVARNEEEDPKVMEIFNELEDGYNLTSLKEKEEIIEKIKELKCDRDKINEWVEAIISGEA